MVNKNSNSRKRVKKFNMGNVTDYGMTSKEHKQYRNQLRTQTKEIPVFPVEISHKKLGEE